MTATPQTPPTPPTPPRASLTARCPEDLLAMAPAVLGFWPEESVVMMTFGAPRPFHARLELPPADHVDPCVLLEVEERLAGTAQLHGAQAVVLVYFTADTAAAQTVHDALGPAFGSRGVEVVTALVADGSHYAAVAPGGWLGPWSSYDVEAHAFVVQAIVDGRLQHRSRDDMVDSLEAVPAWVEPVRDALLASGLPDRAGPVDGRTVRREGTWTEALVRRAVAGDTVPGPAELARLLWWLQVTRVRDAAWSVIDRASAVHHVRLWTAVLRSAPEQLAASPAILLGWSAWQAGDGAQAWAAIDRCRRVDPGNRLAELLDRLLDQAVPPDLWEGHFDWTLGLPVDTSRADLG